MAEKMTFGSKVPDPQKPAASTKQRDKEPGLRREASPVIIVVAIIVLVIALGAGAFYAYNGGWQTDAQKDAKYQHEYMPIMAAKRGDMEPLERENKLRKEHGEPLLQIPKDRHATAADNRARLEELQQKLNAAHGGGSGQ